MLEKAGVFGSYKPVYYIGADVFILNLGTVLHIIFTQQYTVG